MKSLQPKVQAEVPAQVFEEFLTRLNKTDVPTEVVERLRKKIVQEKDFSDKGIRAALFPEDETND